MLRIFRVIGLALMAALAQPTNAAPTTPSIKQIQLTAKHVEGFIAAQKDMAVVTEKMQGSTSDKPDPKIQAELEAIARRFGFKDFAEYDDVAANIAIIMAGIDPQTKAFLDPRAAIQKEIEEVTADKTIPPAEQKRMLEELNEALKSAAPIQYPGNIELVKEYFDRIEKVLQ